MKKQRIIKDFSIQILHPNNFYLISDISNTINLLNLFNWRHRVYIHSTQDTIYLKNRQYNLIYVDNNLIKIQTNTLIFYDTYKGNEIFYILPMDFKTPYIFYAGILSNKEMDVILEFLK